MDNNIDPKVASIVKGLMYAENGGKPQAPKKGKTGELASYFQYTPDTWDMYSQEVSGKKLPMTLENESAVTYAKVKSWYDTDISKGYTPEEATKRVASRWNAGEQRPDAYTQNWKGTNKKYGVSFDTPAYANKVASYASQFEEDANNIPNQVATSTPTPPQAPPSQGLMASASPTQSGLLTPPMKQARQV